MPGVYKLLNLRNACAWPHAVAGYATPFIAPGVTPPFGLVIPSPTFCRVEESLREIPRYAGKTAPAFTGVNGCCKPCWKALRANLSGRTSAAAHPLIGFVVQGRICLVRPISRGAGSAWQAAQSVRGG